MNANEAMNAALRKAAGHGPSIPATPGADATDEQISEWVAWKQTQPKPGHGSADGGARSTGPGLTAAQRMNLLIRRATGRAR